MDESLVSTNINVIQILKTIKRSWMFIFKITAGAFSVGVVWSLLLPEKYTAQCTIVPQTSQEKPSNISGLAAMAGISLDLSTELISPEIYSKVINNTLFLKDLMTSDFVMAEGRDTVMLLHYFTDETYQTPTVGESLLKYTVRLPWTVIGWMKKESEDKSYIQNEIASFSVTEHQCVKKLKGCFSVDYYEKKGCVSITAEMSDAYLSAQLTAHIQRLLQQYITDFKIEKAQAKLKFVNLRYQEAQCNFERKQQERAHFLDANWGLSTALARIQEEKLTTEYNLLYNVYSELAKQREQAEISVKEDTPIFTIVEPVTIPIERSSPRRALICAFCGIVGFLGSLGWRMYKEKVLI